MLKVLHLIKSLGRGGAEMLLPETLRAHDRERFEFAYAYFLDYKNQVVPDLEGQGALVRCFRANSSAAIIAKSAAVARFAKEWGADVIHCHLPIAGVAGRIAGKLAGIPVVYTEHNLLEKYHPLTRRINQLTFGWQHTVIAVSKDVEASARRHQGKNKTQIVTVLNGVNTDHFRRENTNGGAPNGLAKIPSDSPVIGTVAVFRPQKRLLEWLALAKKIHEQLPAAHFVLVGEGLERKRLEDFASQNEMQTYVHFAGLQSEVRPYFKRFDVFLMTSDFEGLPIALLEAMSMECAVFATDVGGVGEVIRNGQDGILVAKDDFTQLEKLLLDGLRQPDQLRRLGKNARQRVQESFSINTMTRQLESIYEKAIEDYRGSKKG